MRSELKMSQGLGGPGGEPCSFHVSEQAFWYGISFLLCDTRAGLLIWAPSVVSVTRSGELLASGICVRCFLSQEGMNHPMEFPIFLQRA